MNPYTAGRILENVGDGLPEIKIAELFPERDTQHNEINLGLDRLLDHGRAHIAGLENFGLQLQARLRGDALCVVENRVRGSALFDEIVIERKRPRNLDDVNRINLRSTPLR